VRFETVSFEQATALLLKSANFALELSDAFGLLALGVFEGVLTIKLDPAIERRVTDAEGRSDLSHAASLLLNKGDGFFPEFDRVFASRELLLLAFIFSQFSV